MNFLEKTPDFMNYNQPVNQWMITQEKWQYIFHNPLNPDKMEA